MVSVLVIATPKLEACGTTTIAPVFAFVVMDATIRVGFVASQPKALVPLSVEAGFIV